MEIHFYDINSVDDSLLEYAVVASEYNGKWIYCKHKERDTWEIPGGHREEKENILETAKRELCEETGAIEFDLEPICVYSVNSDNESYGLLCYASVKQLGKLPDMEIETINFFDNEPDNLTYPHIQPKLFDKVRETRRTILINQKEDNHGKNNQCNGQRRLRCLLGD